MLMIKIPLAIAFLIRKIAIGITIQLYYPHGVNNEKN